MVSKLKYKYEVTIHKYSQNTSLTFEEYCTIKKLDINNEKLTIKKILTENILEDTIYTADGTIMSDPLIHEFYWDDDNIAHVTLSHKENNEHPDNPYPMDMYIEYGDKDHLFLLSHDKWATYVSTDKYSGYMIPCVDE
jgi:hypothetical protein